MNRSFYKMTAQCVFCKFVSTSRMFRAIFDCSCCGKKVCAKCIKKISPITCENCFMDVD